MEIRCQVTDVIKKYGTKTVVDSVSFDVRDGEFVVLLGPSGCGKTTMLRMIAGLIEPSAGSISIDQRVVSSPAQDVFVRPEHRNIGMVFQSYAIWPHMTVFENIAFPLRVRRRPKDEIQTEVAAALEMVGLSGEMERPATALSGGQMQRVALARALVSKPDIVLFDEPLSNLDLKLREKLRTELKDLQRISRLTSIYVTHDQSEAVELADRIVVMNNGCIEQVAVPADLYREPATRFVAEFISTANIFSGKVESVQPDGKVVVQSGGRRLSGIAKQHFAAGDQVTVVIHPEDCQILKSTADGPDIYPATLAQARFQGTSTRYSLEWGGAPIDVIDLGTTPLAADKKELWVRIPSDLVKIIPGPA